MLHNDVEHAVYGQITGELHLSSRYDVEQFMAKARSSQPLSALTGGVHLHTLSAPGEESFKRTCEKLREAGLLYESDKE